MKLKHEEHVWIAKEIMKDYIPEEIEWVDIYDHFKDHYGLNDYDALETDMIQVDKIAKQNFKAMRRMLE